MSVSSAASFGQFSVSDLRQQAKIREQRRKAHAKRSFYNLMHMIVFISVYITLTWMHEQFSTVFAVEHAVSSELLSSPFGEHSRTFHGIHDINTFWGWLDESLLKTIVIQEDSLGHTIPESEWGFFAQYDRLVGGVRMTQHRTIQQKCPYGPLRQQIFYCYPSKHHDVKPFGLPMCNNETEDVTQVVFGQVIHNASECYHPEDYVGYVNIGADEGFSKSSLTDKFTFWLDTDGDQDTIKKRVEYLIERQWIDRQTSSIDIEIDFYNGQLEPVLCTVLLKVHISRVGVFKPEIVTATVPVDPYHTNFGGKIFLEVVFLLFMLHFSWREWEDIRHQAQESGSVGEALKYHYITGKNTFGNMVDFIMIAGGFALYALWILGAFRLGFVREDLVNLGTHRPNATRLFSQDSRHYSEWKHYDEEIQSFSEDLSEAIYDWEVARALAASLVFVIVFRIFKLCNEVHALRNITMTVSMAMSKLVAFGLIVALLVAIFAGAGLLAYGPELEEFHTYPEAIITTLVVMSTGDDTVYNKMFEVDPILSSFWHWLLITIVWLVGLKIILCILVDAYAEAQERLKKEEEEEEMEQIEKNSSFTSGQPKNGKTGQILDPFQDGWQAQENQPVRERPTLSETQMKRISELKQKRQTVQAEQSTGEMPQQSRYSSTSVPNQGVHQGGESQVKERNSWGHPPRNSTRRSSSGQLALARQFSNMSAATSASPSPGPEPEF